MYIFKAQGNPIKNDPEFSRPVIAHSYAEVLVRSTLAQLPEDFLPLKTEALFQLQHDRSLVRALRISRV